MTSKTQPTRPDLVWLYLKVPQFSQTSHHLQSSKYKSCHLYSRLLSRVNYNLDNSTCNHYINLQSTCVECVAIWTLDISPENYLL